MKNVSSLQNTDNCSNMRNVSFTNLFISVVLAIGIVISYLPQHIRIARRKTSEGISPWFMLLGVSSGTCALCNIFLLSTPVISCCKITTVGQCFAGLLGIVQVVLQTSMATIILVLAIICTDLSIESSDQYSRILAVGKICLIHFILSVIISTYVYMFHFTSVFIVANIMGLFGSLLAIIQYFPQILTTVRLKHAGSLSIPMMCMQTPGGFLWAYSLASREGTDWSSWLPYFTAAFLQGILLILAVYLEYFKGGNIIDDQLEPVREPSTEQTPLLSG